MKRNEKKPGTDRSRRKVKITINDEPFRIRRGRRIVSEIKELGKVPEADVLTQVIDGELVPLDDNGFVIIKGKEVFISHVRDGGSS